MTRQDRLQRIADSGYEGKVYATEYYAVDAYDIHEGKVTYDGRYHHRSAGFHYADLACIYRRQVVDKR